MDVVKIRVDDLFCSSLDLLGIDPPDMVSQDNFVWEDAEQFKALRRALFSHTPFCNVDAVWNREPESSDIAVAILYLER